MGVPKEEFVTKKMRYAKGVLKDASSMLARIDKDSNITQETHNELLIECQEIKQYMVELDLFLKTCFIAQKVG